MKAQNEFVSPQLRNSLLKIAKAKHISEEAAVTEAIIKYVYENRELL